MVKKLSLAFASLMALFVLITPSFALADSPKDAIKCGINSAAGAADCNKNPSTGSLDVTIKNILNILSSIVGVAAVIMILVGGLRYIVSGGDAEKVKSAKRTLLFAIIGLFIVGLTQTIVHLVLTEASNPTAPK